MADHDSNLDPTSLGLPARSPAPSFVPSLAGADRALRNARNRQVQRAGLLALAIAVPAVLVLASPGGQSNDSLRTARTPTTAPSASPSPAPGLPVIPPRSAPSSIATGPPGVVGQPQLTSAPLVIPRPGVTPGPDGEGGPAPQPVPARQRPAYAGQIGPGYSQFQGTDCIVANRSSSDGVIRNDYCIYFVTSPSDGRPTWEPNIRICRLYDSTTPGKLTFASGQEADFALYLGRSSDQGPIVDKLLFRFSNTVRYTQGAHSRDVSQGDCWTWQLNLNFDFDAYPEGTGFVGEWRSYSEQFPVNERVRRLHFVRGTR